MASGVRAGKAFVEIHGDLNPLSRALKRIGPTLKQFGKTLAIGAGAVLAPLVAATRSFAAAGDALDKMAARTGLSVENLSALSHAAKLGGTDVSSLENGLRRMQRAAKEAADGTASYADAFNALGVSATDSNGQLKAGEALFMELAEALSRVENDTRRAALAQEIFGRSGTALLPMLANGRAGLEAAADEAKRLGLVMSTAEAKGAAVLTDAMTKADAALKRVWQTVGAALAPTITDLANTISTNAKAIGEWVGKHKELIVTVAKVAAVVGSLGATMLTLGTILNATANSIQTVVVAARALGPALAFLAANPLVAVAAALSAGAIVIAAYAGAFDTATSAVDRHVNALNNLARVREGLNKEVAAGDTTAVEAQRVIVADSETTVAKLEGEKDRLKTRLANAERVAAEVAGPASAGATQAAERAKDELEKILAAEREAKAQLEAEREKLTQLETQQQPSTATSADASPSGLAGGRDADGFVGMVTATGDMIDFDRHADRNRAALADDAAATAAAKHAEAAKKQFWASLDSMFAPLRTAAAEQDDWHKTPFAGLAADDPRAFDPETFAEQNPAATTAGTFSAAAAVGLRSGNEMARTADATEKTAANTGKIARDLLSLVPTFT